MFKTIVRATLVSLAIASVTLSSVQAKGPPKPTKVEVAITQDNGAVQLSPNTLKFERGQLYRLLITNATEKSRYFTATELATRVFSRKVEVLDADGNVIAEVHGQANNLEITPGARVAWYFFPMINGKGILMQSKRRDEAAAIGSIQISGAAPIIKRVETAR